MSLVGIQGLAAFSPDYATARARFRASASARGFALEAIPIGQAGPDGAPLTIDVARKNTGQPERAVIVSSGLHGVEGFFGSAVQLALLEQALEAWSPPERSALILVHALDPYGFAWLRRFDERNIDLNRNFLINGERYQGAPTRYAQLDGLLNPRHAPSRLDLFLLRAGLTVFWYGMPELRQAVAGGQYDFPQGLYFGGHGPAHAQTILAEALPRWVGDARDVLHIDFHTGFGTWGGYSLLLDERDPPAHVAWFQKHFGEGNVTVCRPNGAVYDARGSLGPWCQSRFPECNYRFTCAEFGTYAAIRVVEALRTENQAHHWGSPGDEATLRAKERLKEVFAPADPAWRSTAVEQGVELVQNGMRAVFEPGE
jgi:hypothetical protein